MMDLEPLYLSLKLSVITTMLLIMISLPISYFLAYRSWPLKPFLEAMINLPLVMPPTVLGYYLLVAMGPKGVLGEVWAALVGGRLCFSFSGILIASMIYSLPFCVQPMRDSFEKIDRALIESAYVLGLSPLGTFIKVIMPNSVKGMVVAAILTFAHTMGEFGVVLMVGGSIPGETKVASIAIYEYVEALRYQQANTIAAMLLFLSYAVLLGVYYIRRRMPYGA